MKVLSRLQMIGLISVATMTFSVLAMSDNEFQSNRIQRIQVCAPIKNLRVEKEGKLALLRTQEESISARMRRVDGEFNDRKRLIDDKVDYISGCQSQLDWMERRFDRLTNHMAEEVASLERALHAQKIEVEKLQLELNRYKEKLDSCKRGIRGTFCRRKYKKKVGTYRRYVQNAQNKVVNLEMSIDQLPEERDSLRVKIRRYHADISRAQSELDALYALQPSLDVLEQRSIRVHQEYGDLPEQIRDLEREVQQLDLTFQKCRKMQTLSKAFLATKKEVQKFKENPARCNQVDLLLEDTNRTVKQRAIREAATAVCDLLMEAN